MKKKLRCIMLIDDNTADNQFHEIIIRELDAAERVVVSLNGEEGITYLKQDGQIPPELIFLDINMPRMNGWEFLEAYKDLAPAQKAKVVIVMLTTSGNPEDRARAAHFSEVTGFETKPLTEEMLTAILREHFSAGESE